jgi:hypothetical protein
MLQKALARSATVQEVGTSMVTPKYDTGFSPRGTTVVDVVVEVRFGDVPPPHPVKMTPRRKMTPSTWGDLG